MIDCGQIQDICVETLNDRFGSIAEIHSGP